jgi:hypothetical protein
MRGKPPSANIHRAARDVNGTLAMIRDPKHSVFNHKQLPGGFDDNARGHMAWSMSVDGAAQNPARLVDNVVPAWQAIVEDVNAVS